MNLDVDTLILARPEALERLARALRVTLRRRPADGPALLRWRRQAARVLADRLAAERRVLTRAGAPW